MNTKVIFFAVAAAIALLFSTVFGEQGLLQIRHLQQGRADIDREIARLTAENGKLAEQAQALKNDKRYVENLARASFGLVKANETVYQFGTGGSAPPAAGGAAPGAAKNLAGRGMIKR